jgi:hypothetical protein
MNGYGLLVFFSLLVLAYLLGKMFGDSTTPSVRPRYPTPDYGRIVRPKYDPHAQNFYRLAILHKDGTRGMSRTREQSLPRLIEMARVLKAKPLYAIRVKLKPRTGA